MRLQEKLRGVPEAFHFRVPDGGRAAAEIGVPAVAHFHEHQGFRFLHHQVQFAVARGEIARQQAQTRALQLRERTIFEGRAGRARIHCAEDADAGAASMPAATGRAMPSWKLAQIGTRRTRPCSSAANCPVAPGR